jgi:hypothetical protein
VLQTLGLLREELNTVKKSIVASAVAVPSTTAVATVEAASVKNPNKKRLAANVAVAVGNPVPVAASLPKNRRPGKTAIKTMLQELKQTVHQIQAQQIQPNVAQAEYMMQDEAIDSNAIHEILGVVRGMQQQQQQHFDQQHQPSRFFQQRQPQFFQQQQSDFQYPQSRQQHTNASGPFARSQQQRQVYSDTSSQFVGGRGQSTFSSWPQQQTQFGVGSSGAQRGQMVNSAQMPFKNHYSHDGSNW